MPDFFQDVRYALRQLARSWGFTATAFLSLALGIGATAERWIEEPGAAGDLPAYTLLMSVSTEVLAKTLPAPQTMNHAIRAELKAVNADQQTGSELENLDDWIREEPEWAQESLVTWIFALFGALALLLAGMGLYSVVSYSVAQRTSEFGIRMALGADRRHVFRIVFASTVWSVGAGIVAGVAFTLAMSRVLVAWSAQSAASAWMLGAAVALLALVALAACMVPALRASRVDPMVALRCE